VAFVDKAMGIFGSGRRFDWGSSAYVNLKIILKRN